jgi:membrane complex biogenesis BtpA family protein
MNATGWKPAPRSVIGMIHVGPLPGAPLGAPDADVDRLVEQAASEARLLASSGFDALMIENMHDRPYVKRDAGPEIVAAMTAVGREVRRAVNLPLGVQVLAGGNRQAIAVALACGAAFVRTEGFVFAHVADEGLMESDAAELLRYRRAIGAESVRVFTDLKKKHASHAITAGVSLEETARAAEFFLADGVIVTGTATGRPASAAEVQAVSETVDLPVLVGSGVSPGNLADYAAADAFIVGSSLKRGGKWSNALDPARARAVAKAFRAARPRGRSRGA